MTAVMTAARMVAKSDWLAADSMVESLVCGWAVLWGDLLAVTKARNLVVA